MWKKLFLAILAMVVSFQCWGQESVTPLPSRSPRDVVESLWKRATEGELLKVDGWRHVSELFVNASEYPANGTIRVVSNHWGIESVSVDGEKATVTVEYLQNIGKIDSQLRYTPPRKNSDFKAVFVHHLALSPVYSILYKEDGKTIEQKVPVSKEWQISDTVRDRWTTVNTAIRYVLEIRDKSTDPIIKKNSTDTLKQLLQFQ